MLCGGPARPSATASAREPGRPETAGRLRPGLPSPAPAFRRLAAGPACSPRLPRDWLAASPQLSRPAPWTFAARAARLSVPGAGGRIRGYFVAESGPGSPAAAGVGLGRPRAPGVCRKRLRRCSGLSSERRLELQGEASQVG
ncbi:translation initiation factor IF-2-like [Elephas maximus indicus]|uniref:translation initiation factor IF-2-like n=1 Tax=Elephas maximus indicus TaxID=99487 RepID=UPI0021161F44|nr:translation initiation factor IF-2-like [Elephas maximus indicus]